MAKKQKAVRGNRDNDRVLSKNGRKRNLAIALSSVLVVAAAVATIVYLISRNQSAGTSASPEISGIVSYGGTQPRGTVYIQATDSSGEAIGLGTSIASPGRYSIRNIPAGTYGLTAWMDNTNPQTAVPTALSPRGNITVSVDNAVVRGQNIILLDPSEIPAPTPPTSVGVAPGNGSALVQWGPPVDSKGNLLAQSYNIYYGDSTSVSPETGARKSAQAGNSLFVGGLVDGRTYYFVVTAVLGGVESRPTSPAVSATVGASSGSNTISGAVTFPVSASGPMYVGISSQNSTFFQVIDKPASPQSYSISGVPRGTYVIFAIIDMDNDGVIDTGDLSKTTSNPSGSNTILSVGGDMTGVNETLLASNVLARVTTLHAGSSSSAQQDVYGMQFEVGGNLKLPIRVELSPGRNIAGPTDMSGAYNYYHLFYRVKAKPNMGDSYSFSISYSDGTSERVRVSVTGVLDSFAQNLATTGTDRSKPTFSWSAPASPPPEYSYLIQVGQASIGREWSYPQDARGMPSSQTSVVYNADGTASLTSLQSGTTYDWIIDVTDSNGNQAVYSSTYTP